MDYETLTKLSIETSGTIVLIVIAYKIYKMRVATSSNCCDEHLIVRTNNDGGDIISDLELGQRPRSETIKRDSLII
jgi:hypothetical protein